MKKFLIGLVVLLGGLIGFIASRPSTYHVERSVEMNAPAPVAFDQVDSLKSWSAWSAWEKLDPAIEKTYEGPERGKGAAYTWRSQKVGVGKMTVLESEPSKHVGLELQFIKPWENTARADFTFEPAGSGTKVTWAMEGHSNFVAKAFGLFMDMDDMIGKDFEKGLAGLKDVSEAAAKKQAEEQAAAQAAAAQAAAAQAAAPEAAPAAGDPAAAKP